MFSIICIFALSLAGCGCKKQQPMDQISEEQGGYHYQNKDLGFSIVLPAEFEYYQTQRKETPDYIDLEFFVPTSDTEYNQEVAGYAKPIVIRIFKQTDWQSVLEGDQDQLLFEEIGQKEDKVYTIKFWQEIPEDWKSKWNEEMKQQIIEKFEKK